MEIISVIPRGYCAGVVRAIRIARETAEKYPDTPVTMLGMIVHNRYVVEACSALGIRFVEDPMKSRLQLLDEITEGVVIFTAHGVSDAVRRKAEDKGLIVVDATCNDVLKTHELVRNHASHGDVIYIGRHHHPESEGTVSLSSRVHLVTCIEEAEQLPPLEHVLITCQTTLSLTDTAKIIDVCKSRYPDSVVAEEICAATRVRQEAVMRLENTDLLIVVGDKRSNNSGQLRAIGLSAGIPRALLIDSEEDLREEDIAGCERIAVTSGSSTPNVLTAGVITALKHYAETGELITKKIRITQIL